MRYAEVLAALEVVANDHPWGSALPLCFDDRPLKDAGNTELFIRHSVVFGDGKSTSIGDQCYRYPGLQYLSIFYKTGKGLQTILAKAGEISRYYNNRTVMGTVPNTPNIIFQVSGARKLPQDGDGFSQYQVVCPFYFDSRS